MCATRSEALRARRVRRRLRWPWTSPWAVGVEKLKDTGYAGLISPKIADDGTRVNTSAPANFSLLAPAYQQRYGRHAGTVPGRHDARGMEEPTRTAP